MKQPKKAWTTPTPTASPITSTNGVIVQSVRVNPEPNKRRANSKPGNADRKRPIMPPELFTQLEEKQISEMIETQIDFMIEQEHIHEIDL